MTKPISTKQQVLDNPEILKSYKTYEDFTFPEDLIREFQDKVNQDWISGEQSLSENFIREFQDKLNWTHISYKQNLSEEFIREFQDKVDWGYVSYQQVLSEEFIREFQGRLQLVVIFSRMELPLEEYASTLREDYLPVKEVLSRKISYTMLVEMEACEDGVERFLKHTSKEEEITWTQLKARHSCKSDLCWLMSELLNQ